MAETAFWKHPPADLLAELNATKDGLSSSEAARRLQRYGNNDAAATKRTRPWRRLVRRLGNPLIIVLLLASALFAATGDFTSFVIVTGIVLLSVLLDFVQENRADTAVEALREQVALQTNVRRDGAPKLACRSPSSYLVMSYGSAPATWCRPTACCCQATISLSTRRC
jgi:Mg2+-importing ATPase